MFNAAIDQATGLREMFEPQSGLMVLPMVAARRNMGFRALVTNIAACHAGQGRRTLLVDATVAGVGGALGLRVPYELTQLQSGEREFDEVAVQASEKMFVLRAQRGLAALFDSPDGPNRFCLELRRPPQSFDVVLFAGPLDPVAAMAQDQDDLVFVTAADSDALTATYADIKRACGEYRQCAIRLLVNRVNDERDGMAAFQRLAETAHKFLGIDIEYGGAIVRDAGFVVADRAQCTVFDTAPAGAAAKKITRLVDSMQAWRLGRYVPNEE